MTMENKVEVKGAPSTNQGSSTNSKQHPMRVSHPQPDEKVGKRVCGAKLRGKDAYCQIAPLEGSNRCRIHGGLSLAGTQNGNFKTGRYSKYLPKNLIGQFDEAVTDPKLLDLSANVALMDIRLNELLTKLANNETAESWNELGQLLGPLEKAIEERNGSKATMIMERLLNAWQVFYENKETWSQIIEVNEARRRLVESERKRLLEMDLVLNADRAYMLVAFIQDIILRHVQDQSVRASIAYEIRRVLADGFGRHAGSAGGETGNTEEA